jgi:DNA mismatch repair ATPase MutS
MEFKKTRVKQIITAIKTVRESFKQLEEEQQDNIKDFYIMSIKERLRMIEGYLQSLEHEQPEELDKLQADYNNLLGRYRGLQQRHKNIVDNIKEDQEEKEGQE